MIDFDKAFPTKEEFEQFDISEEIQSELKKLKRSLLSQKIKNSEEFRIIVSKPQNHRGFDGIELYPCFLGGWDSAISGGDYVLNNTYKFFPTIKEQIEQKYPNGNLPERYFQRLSENAMEEWIRGNVAYRFYVLLREGKRQANKFENETLLK